MHVKVALFLLVMVQWVDGQAFPSPPSMYPYDHDLMAAIKNSSGCALHCWENTKYISHCFGDFDCLCSELLYQNSVFQCLYSQCDTSHYGIALQHTIAQCSGVNSGMNIFAAHGPDHHDLRRREVEYLEGSSVVGSGSVYIASTQKIEFQTESVRPSVATATSNEYPSFSLQTVTATGVAITSATPTLLVDSNLDEPILSASSSMLTPAVFEGVAPKEGDVDATTSVVITLIVLYFAF
ncbi:hypothetical protein PVAG01_08693 [Phlyctema vagabunda]|uniref:CFEM domain-containing protein n=1 Tax=Phlyctema vagabunda TaxID=108571 RepID=A0ABR4PA80_9HELO